MEMELGKTTDTKDRRRAEAEAELLHHPPLLRCFFSLLQMCLCYFYISAAYKNIYMCVCVRVCVHIGPRIKQHSKRTDTTSTHTHVDRTPPRRRYSGAERN